MPKSLLDHAFNFSLPEPQVVPDFPLLVHQRSMKQRASRVVRSEGYLKRLSNIYIIEAAPSEEVLHEVGSVQIRLPRLGITN